jgi:hypothetical protein
MSLCYHMRANEPLAGMGVDAEASTIAGPRSAAPDRDRRIEWNTLNLSALDCTEAPFEAIVDSTPIDWKALIGR